MKKRVLAVLVSAVLAMSMTACGGSAPAEAPAETATEEAPAEETAAEESAEADSEMCDDETFAALQEEYAALSEVYDLVENYYLENDDIEQDDDVEELLTQASDYLDEVGEISQEDITTEDAAELAQSMLDVCEALQTTAEALDLMAASGSEEAADEMCDDESFAALQEGYAALSEVYDLVENYYLENDDIEQDDDVEELLSSASDYLDEVGEIEQADITTADAQDLAQSMVDVANALQQTAEALDIMANN